MKGRYWTKFIIELAGAWQDFPSIDDLRENSGEDVSREKL
jgi:hypothetical protein